MRSLPVLVVLLVTTAGVACAQVAGRPVPTRRVLEDSSVQSIFATNGPQANGAHLTRLLRQANRPQSQARLDSIGDGLEAVATSDARLERAMQALSDLQAAASPTTEKTPGIPYGGLATRLKRIHATGVHVEIRQLALGALIRTDDRPGALAYLRQVAEGDDGTAWKAIQVLANDADLSGGSDSKAILRALFEGGSVRDVRGRRDLLFYATAHGWAP